MKKVLIILLVISLLISCFIYIKNNNEYKKIVNMNVEIICYQEQNRLTIMYMKEDGVSRDDQMEKLQKVADYSNSVSVKNGFKSFEEVNDYLYKNFSAKTMEKLNSETKKIVRQKCSPNYSPIGY